MKTLNRTLIALVAAGVLSACGGGGGQTNAVPGASMAPPPSSSSTNRTPLGTATLTLAYAGNFHTAKGASRASKTASRNPAYVNSNANYLDVWVISGGVAVHAVNSTGPANVNNLSGNGTQTFQIPIYSTNASQIVAYETDQQFQAGGNLLAIGEADLSGYTPGTPVQLSLTMLMNAQFIGIADNPDDADTLATISALPGTPFNARTVYFFAADPDGGFVDAAGTGGVSAPIVTSVTPPGIFSQNAGVNAGYAFSTCVGGTVAVSLTAVNPAYALASNVSQFGGLFAGATFLYANGSDSSFGSYISSIVNALGAPTISNTFGITASSNC